MLFNVSVLIERKRKSNDKPVDPFNSDANKCEWILISVHAQFKLKISNVIVIEFVNLGTFVVESTREHRIVAIPIHEKNDMTALSCGDPSHGSKSQYICAEARWRSESFIKAHIARTCSFNMVLKNCRRWAEGQGSKTSFDHFVSLGLQFQSRKATVIIGSTIDDFGLREYAQIVNLFVLPSRCGWYGLDCHPVVRAGCDQTGIPSTNWNILYRISDLIYFQGSGASKRAQLTK